MKPVIQKANTPRKMIYPKIGTKSTVLQSIRNIPADLTTATANCRAFLKQQKMIAEIPAIPHTV